MPLVIELFHHITRILDIQGADKKQYLPLSDEASKELTEVIVSKFPNISAQMQTDAKDFEKLFSIDGYNFHITKLKTK